MFQKLSDERLRALAEDLAIVSKEKPIRGAENATRFARCLSVMMICELATRRQADDQATGTGRLY